MTPRSADFPVSRRSHRRAAALGLSSIVCMAAPLACGGHGAEPLTLLASFPEDAIAVCFVREDDGSEIGCTTRPLRAGPDGTLAYRGTQLELRTTSPSGLIAVVSGIHAPDIPRDETLKVRAVAYNEAGASDPSAQFFALDRKSKGFPRSQERHIGLASDRRK